jgi:hypothetical protein
MPPVVSWRQGSQPRGAQGAAILLACETAAADADFAGFDTMVIWLVAYAPKPIVKRHREEEKTNTFGKIGLGAIPARATRGTTRP